MDPCLFLGWNENSFVKDLISCYRYDFLRRYRYIKHASSYLIELTNRQTDEQKKKERKQLIVVSGDI